MAKHVSFGGDQMDLVKQFDSMRNSQGGNPVSLASYAPPPGPDMEVQRAQFGGMPSLPSGNLPAGHHPGDGHNHGAPAQKGAQGTIQFNGRTIAAGLRSYAEQLSAQGLRLSSGYRDAQHNARVGGVPGSWHTKQGSNGALDFVGTAKQMQQGAAWARQNGAREVLIHNVGSGQHLHVAW